MKRMWFDNWLYALEEENNLKKKRLKFLFSLDPEMGLTNLEVEIMRTDWLLSKLNKSHG